MKAVTLMLFAFSVAAFCWPAFPQQAVDQEKPYLKASPEDMEWWREARFGLFIHWGPVSLKGTEIGWSRGGERRGREGTGQIPVEIYDNLYKEFNPTEFDADEWVAIAQQAGMKYLVFTTKHHDGFVNFDSKLTDYKITSPESPFGRDVVKELADACHKAGLGLGFYYSQPDWHHPDYRTENHAKYIEYLHGQLRELCTNYGQIDIIWFDGLGGTAEDWNSEPLFKMIRELQPHVLINNRAGLPGDFDTPEQRVGKFQNDRPWESCITICRQWAWKPDDAMKSLEECMRTLVRCAGGDGNLLFNVGPMPSGAIEPRQVERLKEMGAWLDQYGESIYGTRGGPYKPGNWGASTYSGDTIYLHIFEWDGDAFVLPPLERNVRSARLMKGGEAAFQQTADALTVTVPESVREPIDTVIVLKLDGSAADISPRAVSASLTAGKTVKTSNVYRNSSHYTGDMAVDDDDRTRWATDAGTSQAWIEVDLGAPTTFNRVLIDEALEKRVQAFTLEYKEGDSWQTLLQGTTIGPIWTRTFEPVTAQYVRLNISEATEGPTIWQFHLYPPKEVAGK